MKFIILALIFLLMGGCGYMPASNEQPNVNQGDVDASELTVEVISNIVNGGSFFGAYGSVYGRFIETEYGFQIAISDDSGNLNPIPVEMASGNIIVHEDYLYFKNFSPPYNAYETQDQKTSEFSRIYRYGLADGSLTKLTEEAVTAFYIYDRYIYYQLGIRDDSGWPTEETANYSTQIMRMSLDTEAPAELVYEINDARVSSLFVISQNRIVLPLGLTSGNIAIYDTEKKTTQDYADVLQDEGITNVQNLVPKGSYIYFRGCVPVNDSFQPNYLYRLDLKTEQLVKLSELDVLSFCLTEEIAIIDAAEGIYTYNLETRTESFLAQVGNSMLLNVVGDKLYIITSGNRAERSTLVALEWRNAA